MFLCKDCHKIDICKKGFLTHRMSTGPCEGCAKVTVCADCPPDHARET